MADNYVKFIELIRLLASNANDQINYLPANICKADEIALLFNDIYLMFPQINIENQFHKNVESILTSINSELDEMSKNINFWTDKSLLKDREWELIRELSKKLLLELNEEYKKPDIQFYTWIL